MVRKLNFNSWSWSRINQGRKFCTSRTKPYEDERVRFVVQMKLKDVKELLWQTEGANSPEEFEKVWRGIFRGKFEPDKNVYVHFGNFRDVKEQGDVNEKS